MLERIFWLIAPLALSAMVVRNALRERWPRRYFVATAIIVVIETIWWSWAGFEARTVSPWITRFVDIINVVVLIVLERWLNRCQLQGPLGLLQKMVAEAIDWLLVQLPHTGRRTQERTCQWSDIDDEGHLVVGSQKLSILRLEPPGRLNEPELQQLALALAKAGLNFKLLRLTRPLDVSDYAEKLQQLWFRNHRVVGNDGSEEPDPTLLPVFEEHLLALQPHLVENRDPLWPLSLATLSLVVVEADEELERRIAAIGRRAGVKVERLNTYQVMALLRQTLNHEVLSLSIGRDDVQTAKNLKDIAAPARFRPHGDCVEITSQNGQTVWWGFATVALTGETPLGVLAEAVALSNLDLVVQVSPKDAYTEANLLANRQQASATELELAAEYRGGYDQPVEVRGILVFRSSSQGSLREAQEEVCKGLTSHYRGVTIRPVRGRESVEAAFRASQPLLADVAAPPLKQPATELAELLISVGEMELSTSPIAVHLGQGEDGMPVFIDQWRLYDLQRHGPAHLAIAGVTGCGKTFLSRYMTLKELLAGQVNHQVVFDLKGMGDSSRFARAVCPANMRLVVVDPDQEDAFQVLEGIRDGEKLFLVVESSSMAPDSVRRLAQVMEWVWRRTQRVGVNDASLTRVVFDEAWRIVRDPADPAGQAMLMFFRQGHSYGCRCVIITQDPDDLTADERGFNRLGAEILSQCPVTVVGAVGEESQDTLRKWGLPPRLVEAIPLFRQGEFLMVETNEPERTVNLHVTPKLVKLLERRA